MVIKLEQVNIDTHPISTLAGEMNQLITPLKERAGIIHLAYKRLYKNKQELFLTTTPEASQLFTKEKFYNYAYCGDPDDYKPGYYLSNFIDGCSMIDDAERERCGLDHTFFMIKKEADYAEFTFFSAAKENYSVNNFYMNHTDYLENFVKYFKKRASKLIYIAEQHLVQWPESASDVSKLIDSQSCTMNLTNNNAKFRYLSHLTSRERELMKYIGAGLVNKEIARITNISVRTVEKHAANIYRKCKCRNRHELMAYFFHNFSK